MREPKTVKHMLEDTFISRCSRGYFQDWHIYNKYSDRQHVFNHTQAISDLP